MTKPRRVNSYDVAKRAGVSQSAVSRTFTPGASVAPKTREKVLCAARELGYAPNAMARSLITRRSQIVAVVITNLSTQHYPDILIQLGIGLQTLDQHMLLFTVNQETGLESVLPQILQYQVDGIICCVTMTGEQAKWCRDRDVQVVLFNRSIDSETAVCCDHVAAGHQLASLLYAAGHRRFAFVGGPADAPVSAEREHGFVTRLEELGIAAISKLQSDYSYAGGYATALEFIRNNNSPPEAIFCANDSMALGVLDALRFELAINVPEDISVVGFDDVTIGSRPAYQLTTIHQPLTEMTEVAISLLQERIKDPATKPAKHLIPASLTIRKSARLS